MGQEFVARGTDRLARLGRGLKVRFASCVLVYLLAAPRLAEADINLQTIADTVVAKDGRTFVDLSGVELSLRSGGRMLFTGAVSQNSHRQNGLWLLGDDGLSLVVAEGATLGDEGSPVNLEFGDDWQVDPNGDVSGVVRTGANFRDAFIQGQPGHLLPLLTYGEMDPSIADATLSSISLKSSSVSDKAMLWGGYTRPPLPGQTTIPWADFRSWLLVSGELQAFVNAGDEAPGPVQASFAEGPIVYAIAPDGRILFQASTSAGEGNWFSATDKEHIEFVAQLQALPAPFNGTIDVDAARLSSQGDLTVVSNGYAAGSGTLEKNIWYGKPSALELVARGAEAPQDGAPSPGGPHVLWDLDGLSLSQSGQWMAVRGRPDNYSSPGLWVGPPNQLHEILIESEAVPGVPGIRCTAIDEFQINEHGQLAIFAETSVGDAVFRYDARRGLELVAASLMPITIDGNPQSGNVDPYLDGDSISDDGRVYLMTVRQTDAGSRWTLIRSEPLAAGDDDAARAAGGGASGGSAGDGVAGAGDQNGRAVDVAGAAGAAGSGSQTDVAGGAPGMSSASAAGEGGASASATDPQLSGSVGKARDESGCNLGRAEAPGSFGFGLTLVALLIVRKRRARRRHNWEANRDTTQCPTASRRCRSIHVHRVNDEFGRRAQVLDRCRSGNG